MKKETEQVNEHTPLPWKLRVVRRNGDEDGYEIYSSNGRDVSTDCHMLDKADAEFLLCAANAHDELVAAIRKFTVATKFDTEFRKLDYRTLEAFNELGAALTKAGVQS